MIKGIKNAKFITPRGIIKGCLGWSENGNITRIGNLQSYKEFFDAKGCYVLPGAIETHGHMREPGFSHKGTVETETKAAAAGGVTTIFDMPNTVPPTTTRKRLDEKIKKIFPGRAFVDYGFFFGASTEPGYLEELNKVDKNKIMGVKIFTAGHETTPTTVSNICELADIFEILGKRKIIAVVHSENQALIDYFTKKLKLAGRKDLIAYSHSRNPLVVLTSTLEIISLSYYYKTKLYLLHLSAPEEFKAVRFAKSLAIPVMGEIVSYTLNLNFSHYKKLGNKIKSSPAIRSPEIQKKFWQLLKNGEVDAVCSEHTPHTLKEKEGDAWQSVSGMPGIQESRTLLINGWLKNFGKNTLESGLVKIADLTSKNIAEFFGLKRKGTIQSGKDADLVVIDTENFWKIKKEDLLTKNQWSPYENWRLKGKPLATFLRGQLIYENGKIVSAPRGKWLHSQ